MEALKATFENCQSVESDITVYGECYLISTEKSQGLQWSKLPKMVVKQILHKVPIEKLSLPLKVQWNPCSQYYSWEGKPTYTGLWTEWGFNFQGGITHPLHISKLTFFVSDYLIIYSQYVISTLLLTASRNVLVKLWFYVLGYQHILCRYIV